MFNPSRLTLARQRRGLSKTALAKLTKSHPNTILALEDGKRVPTDSTIAVLAEQLSFPVEFFHGTDVEAPGAGAANFRSWKTIRASRRDSTLAAGAIAMELCDWIHARFELPAPDLPECEGLDPEAAAELVRAEWQLGEERVPNLVHLLEAHGVRVFSLDQESADIDAFSAWWDGVPFVFLNQGKSAERSRFDAAHELAHLVLHRAGKSTERELEVEANAFASAFLMPRASVLAVVAGWLVSLDALIELKHVWGVAAAALAYRLHRLGVISDWHYRTLFKQMGYHGMRTEEPEPMPRETSRLLDRVFTMLREEGIMKCDVARELAISERDLDSLIFGLAMLPVKGRGATRGGGAPELKVVEYRRKES